MCAIAKHLRKDNQAFAKSLPYYKYATKTSWDTLYSHSYMKPSI